MAAVLIASARSPEDPLYLERQLITCLGNKRALLGPIRSAVETVCRRTGREDDLRMLDAFSGSGVVSRLFRRYASELVANDTEDYARVISECYLCNRSAVPMPELEEIVREMNRAVDERLPRAGFIRGLYAPADRHDIRAGERVFYTPENAYRLDAYRQLLDEQPDSLRSLLLGPLLSAASIHANTAGVFKGFYKDRATGIGRFGGSGADALSRITAPITLHPPVLSRFECECSIHQMDANRLVTKVGHVDVAYFDPPYNQHPYGSNYFMLNLLVNYEEPDEISRVSGIPKSWFRSDYNRKRESLPRLQDLITVVDADFIILSFNDEGFVSPPEIRELLSEVGTVAEQELPHATFRGSRNLRNRSLEVTEHVYLVERH
jgi:adenine-specific DNA-methyltransferase